MSKPGLATIFTIPTGMLNHLGNETRADCANVHAEFPLVVRIWYKLVFWREIKTQTHLRHCRDSSKVKSLHLGPAMYPEYQAPREPGIQMTGALSLCRQHYQIHYYFCWKNVKIFCTAKDSHIFSNKKNKSGFDIFTFLILTKR